VTVKTDDEIEITELTH